ncbi:hypothetical protein N7495_006024 [Penicillium taxi]|uniref:uncharacterized protein n=1 Tax=Penicillium taxi TaxID=168475 RepID=UPI0025458E22|nr:uncharacterized protein N7495_006024 [Penicillium taxi]KAJ5894333.1 hypothetical protein N7495_006024 [Penicillium taxi]
MVFFTKRLRCFGCGQRPSQTIRGPIRKFHCDHCGTENYLDENGDITDPPVDETNPDVYGPSGSPPPFESVDFKESDLFCSKCLRNQHLLAISLAEYLPPSDDPNSAEYEDKFAQYRSEMEDRYPQVCDACEPRARQRIKQAGYDAKADYLGRMMDQSRASKVARRARNRSWQSLLVYIGALSYWVSVFGQFAWNAVSALTVPSSQYLDTSFSSCAGQTLEMRRIPSECAFDLAPYAGMALVAGFLSLWWNPKLRMKVDGKFGRFARLGEYYQIQLITLVSRCVFWALLNDPSSSGLDPSLPPALHMFMIIFTVLSVVISRRVVQYDTRPLVNWSDHSWETAPIRTTGGSKEASPISDNALPASNNGIRQRFPIEKLGTPGPATKSPHAALSIPPSPSDEMDWTPSAPSQTLKPTVSVYQRDQKSVLDGPLPFYGSIPAVSRPPAWNLRAKLTAKPIERVVEPNPFHKAPTHPVSSWQKKGPSPEPVFKAPKFFPSSDYAASTGLEDMFNKALGMNSTNANKEEAESRRHNKAHATSVHRHLQLQYLRIVLLFCSIAAWYISQSHLLSISGNYIEACALGSASLIAGFALLDVMKSPLADWNGMEILIYITEIALAIHFGAHLPRDSFERDYFDRYGKLLLMFMLLQEILGLLSFYRAMVPSVKPDQANQPPQNHPVPSQLGSPQNNSIHSWLSSPQQRSPSPPRSAIHSPSDYPAVPDHFEYQSHTPPPLSFGSTAGSSSFSSTLPSTSGYGGGLSQSFNSYPKNQSQNSHSFTMQSLKENYPYSDYEQESDSETVATSTTVHTDVTSHNIRYALNPTPKYAYSVSPRRNGLDDGIFGLSLGDHQTPRRVTRSQTQRLGGQRLSSRAGW